MSLQIQKYCLAWKKFGIGQFVWHTVLEQIAALLPNPTNVSMIIGEIRANNECFYACIAVKFLWATLRYSFVMQ